MFTWFGQRSKKNQQKIEENSPGESGKSVPQGNSLPPASPDVIRSLLQTAIADAEQMAASIEARARTEAEAEAARIISQAELEVQEIKEKAEKAARQQAEEIITEANKKAEITETEAKQRATRFLIGVGEEVGKEINEEYRKAYSRLASSLQDLMGEGQKIEVEWQGKAAQLGQSQGFELKEYGAMLLGTAEATVPATAVPTPAGAQLEADTSGMEPVAESILPQEAAKREAEEAKGAKKQAAEEARLAAKEAAKRKAVEAKGAKKVQKQAKKEAKLAATEEPVVEPVRLEEEAVEEPVVEPVRLEEEVVEELVVEPVRLEEEAVEEPVEEPAPPILDSQAPYTGEVELIIASPTELKLVSRLYNYLQTVPELRILYTRGSWDQGTTIIVVLDKPMPLIGILSQTPGVKIAPEMAGRDSAALGRVSPILRGERKTKRIKLNLREE